MAERPFDDLSVEEIKPKKQITLYRYESKILKGCWTAEIVIESI